jgi:hypothetical protein
MPCPLRPIADLKQRMPFDLYGYCLMSNHIHFAGPAA